MFPRNRSIHAMRSSSLSLAALPLGKGQREQGSPHMLPCVPPYNSSSVNSDKCRPKNDDALWMSDDRFLSQVEQTVDRVVQKFAGDGIDILCQDRKDALIPSLPSAEREAVGVTRHLHERLSALQTNKDCRRCWLQQAHCICRPVRPLRPPSLIRRIFLLMHHKEIGMAVDTAKLILAAYPDVSRLVVGGIPSPFQDSMKEMMDSISDVSSTPTLVLFPSDNAQTLDALFPEISGRTNGTAATSDKNVIVLSQEPLLDLIVIDGTWEQARRLYNRYIFNQPVANVQLSMESLQTLEEPAANLQHLNATSTSENNDISRQGSGKQLRRHPVPIREIATAHALDLLFHDFESLSSFQEAETTLSLPRNRDPRFGHYLELASAAAVRQLGPTRTKQSPRH